MNLFLRIGIIVLLFFCVTSCRSKSCWKQGSLTSECPKKTYSYTKLPGDGFLEILTVEIRERSETPIVYINSLSRPFTASEDDENAVLVHVKSDQEILNTLAYRHQGGQRLQLNKQACSFLTEHLNNGQSCLITIGSRQRLVPPMEYQKNLR